jgi:hypothetical protein
MTPEVQIVEPTAFAMVKCGHCAGGACHCEHGIDPEWCCQCDGLGDVPYDLTWAVNLAGNLAIGGALAAAYAEGRRDGYSDRASDEYRDWLDERCSP